MVIGTDNNSINVTNDAASYWSSFGHMATDNPHQLSFMNTSLPLLPPTFSSEYNFDTHPQPPLASGSDNPLVTLEQWVEGWCQRNGKCSLAEPCHGVWGRDPHASDVIDVGD